MKYAMIETKIEMEKIERSDKIEMVFSSRRFLQKMNERIQFYYYETCFSSFFGGN